MVLIHGFSGVIGSLKRRGNRLNVSRISLAQFTWLKPGVNETGLSLNEFDSLRCRNRLIVQGLAAWNVTLQLIPGSRPFTMIKESAWRSCEKTAETASLW